MNKLDYILDRKKINKHLDLSTIRIIAMVTMFLDHFALMIIGNGILYGYRSDLHAAALETVRGKTWEIIYIVLRSCGRISFPLFCFMLVEGFLKTHNKFLYAVRLLFLALISEIPFNLVCGNSLFFTDKQNTVFTLFVGFIMLTCISLVEKKLWKNSYIIIMISELIVVVIFSYISYVIKLDYNVIGILLIAALYIFYTDKILKTFFLGIAGFITSFIGIGLRYYGVGVISIIPFWLYDGKVGKMDDYKLFYYLFYPLHLLVLYGFVYFSFLKR